MAGLMSGFMDGYGFAAGVQDRKARQAQQQQRIDQRGQYYEDEKAHRDKSFALKQDTIAHGREREAVADERYATEKQLGDERYETKYADQRADADREFKSTQNYRRSQIGLSAQRAKTAASQEARAANRDEIEIADAQRAQKEQQNARYLQLAAEEKEAAGGFTPRVRELMKQGGVNTDRMLDPKFNKATDTLVATLNGAPIRKEKKIEAGGVWFKDRINKVVGSQTKDGRTITSAELADYYPSKDGEHVTLKLKIGSKKDGQGQTRSEYQPVTSSRSADDEYVLEVPMNKVLGQIKGQQLLDKAFQKHQIAGALREGIVMNGGQMDADDDTSQALYKRQQKASDKASKEWDDQHKNFNGNVDMEGISVEQREKEINAGTDAILARWARSAPEDGDESVVMDLPGYGPVTEADMRKTMREEGQTYEEVFAGLSARLKPAQQQAGPDTAGGGAR